MFFSKTLEGVLFCLNGKIPSSALGPFLFQRGPTLFSLLPRVAQVTWRSGTSPFSS